MGRFDALTQLEEKKENKPPIPEVPSLSVNISQMQNTKKGNESDKKPAKPQALLPASPLTRKPAKPPLALELLDKPEKYTTRLEPSLVKKVRLHAIEKDIKDYEVVRMALNQYFERNK
jgi:hypothetical protein